MSEMMLGRLEVHFHPELSTRTDSVTVRDPLLGVEETYEVSPVRAKDDREKIAKEAKDRFVEDHA